MEGLLLDRHRNDAENEIIIKFLESNDELLDIEQGCLEKEALKRNSAAQERSNVVDVLSLFAIHFKKYGSVIKKMATHFKN